MGRGQTTLPAVAIALVLLTAVTTVSVAMADSAISRADRTPGERRVAAAVAERLVAADGPLGERANLLNDSRVAAFDAARLRTVAPVTADYDVAVQLDGTTIASTGGPTGGTTMRRLVLRKRTTTGTLDPNGASVTIPRRASTATVSLTPSNGTTVWTVRANDRVVLHDDDGLSGTFEVSLSPYETTTLRFQTAGTPSDDAVDIEYAVPRTRKATLAVTVDA